MQRPEVLQNILGPRRERWLVTGAAGFIGSHLTGALLRLGQTVRGLDNLSTGKMANLEAVRLQAAQDGHGRFDFVMGDIRDPGLCREAMSGITVVLHQAALPSVPASLKAPLECHAVNVTGFCNILEAARLAGVQRVVHASSSAVYGDAAPLPKVETMPVAPRSPYGLAKSVNEQYASLYRDCFGLETVSLRYFNIYGPRQNPAGDYAAVIPLWFAALVRGQSPVIYGDGGSSRDFCHVDDVVAANVLAALAAHASGVYNIGSGKATTLLELFAAVRQAAASVSPAMGTVTPRHQPSRVGDIRHSLADITRARQELGFVPTIALQQGVLAMAAAMGIRQDRPRA